MATPNVSFEFFPPSTDAQKRRFWHTLGCLETLKPAYVSVTWGALGADNQPSLEVLRALNTESSLTVAAHLTCYGCTRANMLRRLTALQKMGVNHIVALRGDVPAADAQQVQKQRALNRLPVNSNLQSREAETLQNAVELVALIRQASGMEVSVAAYPESHPESPDRATDLRHLKAKLDAGANRALTQFFFKADTYLRWRDEAEDIGIYQPLVPGILPIHDIDRVQVFARRCGTHVPAWLVAKFDRYRHDKQAMQDFALEHALELCNALQSEGVNDFHIYTLNQSTLAYSLGQGLLGSAARLAAA